MRDKGGNFRAYLADAGFARKVEACKGTGPTAHSSRRVSVHSIRENKNLLTGCSLQNHL